MLKSLVPVPLLLIVLGAPPASANQLPAVPLDDSNESAPMRVEEVSHGFGQLLPHRVRRLGLDGVPTTEVIPVKRYADLALNVTADNPILPVPSWPVEPRLPDGKPGNHFIVARFSRALDIDTILSPVPTRPNESGAYDRPPGMTGAIRVVRVDPFTGEEVDIPGRAFVGGRTYAGASFGTPPRLPLQEWVRNVSGRLVVNPDVDNDGDGVPDGRGFPGTEGAPFVGAGNLVARDTFVFVVDSDGDMRTHGNFPAGAQIAIRISQRVGAVGGDRVALEAHGSATVGRDGVQPALRTDPATGAPAITPGGGDTDVDPRTRLFLEFTEPVQPLSLGDLDDGSPPEFVGAVRVEFGPPGARTRMPFGLRPRSILDLTRWELLPAYPFPGSGAAPGSCGDFSRIEITIDANGVRDLARNFNARGAMTSFETGQGVGVVNAPVAPDAVYVASGGAQPGLSVIDLNGFGASTGNPEVAIGSGGAILEGSSNYVNNPNVSLQGASLQPPLAPGTCTWNGGSAGVFTRTLDSNLQPLLTDPVQLQSLSDMALGHALDTTFNNSTMGCQSGGGSLCASTGLKQVGLMARGVTVVPSAGASLPGTENPISWAPHPNPPPLSFPPLCASPNVGGLEPTSVDTPLVNLLAPGDPFGSPGIGLPPSGLLSSVQNAYFQGPSLPNPAACSTYGIRQQVGHFLYALDRQRRELVVLNSNRMRVIDRLPMSDPTRLAVAPNLGLLAVTNRSNGKVSFVDIDPASGTFHEVVAVTKVGTSPSGIAWCPGNEDILVCNEGDGTVSILSAFSLQVRKTVGRGLLSAPFDVAVTPRQTTFGYVRNVYFAYFACRDGRVAVFESGPSGINGWGYDDVIGFVDADFGQIQRIEPDPLELDSGAWVVHSGPDPTEFGSGAPGGRVSRLKVQSGIFGLLPLVDTTPRFRDMVVEVVDTLGPETLSGVPVDIAFDDLGNLGALGGWSNVFSAGSPAPVNGKGLVRQLPGGVRPTSSPGSMFVAVPNPAASAGVVDVIDLATQMRRDTNAYQPGIQSIPAPGVSSLMNYFEQ